MTLPAGLHRIPLADYLADPCEAPSLSASLAHTLLSRSPRHAWHESQRLNPDYQHDDSEQADIGTIAHAILLESNRSRVVVVDADDWRTKAAREARDNARTAGKLPILIEKMSAVEEMVSAARNAIAAGELAHVFEDGDAESSIFWKEDNIWCRARPDWVSKDRRVLCDYKTHGGSVEPNTWSRGPLLANGYDLQCAHAMRGMMAIAKPRDVSFVFMCQETDPPYAVSLVSLSPTYIAFAEAKLASARAIWGECLRTNRWPGYPMRVCYAEPPIWAEYQWSERQATVVDDGRPLAEQLWGEEK